jgi:hypothetical protein
MIFDTSHYMLFLINSKNIPSNYYNHDMCCGVTPQRRSAMAEAFVVPHYRGVCCWDVFLDLIIKL